MRSDREHCASRVAVEQEEEERRGGEEQATDIKSNNPHLAGGEKGDRHGGSRVEPLPIPENGRYAWLIRPYITRETRASSLVVDSGPCYHPLLRNCMKLKPPSNHEVTKEINRGFTSFQMFHTDTHTLDKNGSL